MRRVWLGLALALLLAACGKGTEPKPRLGEETPGAVWDNPNAKWDDPGTTWGP